MDSIPAMWKPWTIQLVTNSISTFTRKYASPSVRMISGIASTATSGFTSMLTALKTKPARTSVSAVSPLTATPDSSFAATHSAATLQAQRTRNQRSTGSS